MLPPRPLPAIDTRRLRSFDGTEIAYHVTSSPTPGAPWIVLAGGLTGGFAVWRGQIEYFCDRYRFLSWDYRGLYASERPRPDRASAYEVPCHARDLEAVLNAEKVDRASFVGWSVGVQVALSAFWRVHGRVQSLALLSGAASRPLDGISRVPGARTALLAAAEVARRGHALSPFGRKMGRREALAWLTRLGLAPATVDETTLTELTRAFARLDVDALLRNVRAFATHDANVVLGTVDVPALVVAGDRDPLLPGALASQMARRIPSAELFVVRGGSHYALVEYPELLSLRLERFFREHGC